MGANPVVFVSYSHDNDEHKEWVCKISSHLRTHGVDVVLDQWDLRVGGDLPFFMEQGLTKARLVICVCSKNYVDKANAAEGGVGYEKMILTQSLMCNSSIDYVIPLIRNNRSSQKVPIFLGTKVYLDFENDDEYYIKYRELIERIFDEDIKKKPPLGKSPFLPEITKVIYENIEAEKIKYYSPQMNGHVKFSYLNNSGDYTIGAGEYTFITHWSRHGQNSIYAYRDKVKKIGYLKGVTKFPEASELSSFDFSSRSREPIVGEVIVWINYNDNIAVTQILSVDSNENIMEFEYKIYPDTLQEK